jgi:ubiquinone/menaquinone biosynthesis C-methylase UbiE
MIQLAKRYVPTAQFLISDGRSVPCDDDQFTAAFSCEVFQHFDNRELATLYFREIFRVMKHGGTLMIHVPIAVLPFRRVAPTLGDLQAFLWKTSDRWQQLKSRIKRWQIVHQNREPFYRLVQYDPDWLYARMMEIGFRDVQLWIVPVTGNPGQKVLAPYLFATKPMQCA